VTDIVLLLTTVETPEHGHALARVLVEEQLAACVSVLPPMTSFYRWQGTVQRAAECQVIVKTTRERLAATQGRMRELHAYELPEGLVIAVESGAEAYLDWIADATRPPR
jgi:periplasmic divalent cation tolerance protein